MASIVVNAENFESEVMQSNIPVLLDFWAEWCPPCQMIAPIIEEVAETYAGKIKVSKIDIDSASELAQKFNVTSIPTLLLINKGEVVKQQVGAVPKPSIEEMLKPYL